VNFADRLFTRVGELNSRVVVGLDPETTRVPAHLIAGDDREARATGIERFCRGIIDSVATLCAAVKPQAAFFEALGAPGFAALERVCAHAHAAGVPVILDAKRGDIGSTSAAYAAGLLVPSEEDSLGAHVDALTVNPYLGSDGVGPFIQAAEAHGKGLFILAKTSNPSSGEFQDRRIADSGRPLYEVVGQKIAEWGRTTVGECGYSSIGAVVGATYPEMIESLRALMPQTPFLVPGYGAQGAGPADVARAFDPAGLGAVVNASRGIIFAYTSGDYGPERFALAAADACARMRDDINGAR